MSVAIIINPIAGGRTRAVSARHAAHAAAQVSAHGESADVFLTEGKGHARELAARAATQGARLVIAWGGDGTVNEVGSAVVGTSSSLGIVPVGSGNGLARALGMSRRPETALAQTLRSTPRLIDAGEFDGRWFFNMAGVGIDAHIAACFDAEGPGRRGLVSYARISLRELGRYRAKTYRIDGSPSCQRGAMIVSIANSPQFGNGFSIAPDARLDDGKLDLVVVEERSVFRSLCAVPPMLMGRFPRVKGVTIRSIERIVIESDEPMLFHVDGEPVHGGTKAVARVHPAALRICA